jgi:hypothetical protein
MLLAGCGGGATSEAPAADIYTTPFGAFAFRLPDGVTDAAGEDPRCGQAAVCWAAEDFTLVVEEADVGDVTDVAAYVDLVLPNIVSGTAGTELLDKVEATTASSLPAVQTEVSMQDGLVHVFEQWTLSDGQMLRLYFTGLSDSFDETVRPIAEETFLSVKARAGD